MSCQLPPNEWFILYFPSLQNIQTIYKSNFLIDKSIGIDMNELKQKACNKLLFFGISPLVYISYLFNDFEKNVIEKFKEGIYYVIEKIEEGVDYIGDKIEEGLDYINDKLEDGWNWLFGVMLILVMI